MLYLGAIPDDKEIYPDITYQYSSMNEDLYPDITYKYTGNTLATSQMMKVQLCSAHDTRSRPDGLKQTDDTCTMAHMWTGYYQIYQVQTGMCTGYISAPIMLKQAHCLYRFIGQLGPVLDISFSFACQLGHFIVISIVWCYCRKEIVHFRCVAHAVSYRCNTLALCCLIQTNELHVCVAYGVLHRHVCGRHVVL